MSLALGSIASLAVGSLVVKTQKSFAKISDSRGLSDLKMRLLESVDCDQTLAVNQCGSKGQQITFRDRFGETLSKVGNYQVRGLCADSLWGLKVEIKLDSGKQWQALFSEGIEVCSIDQKFTSLPKPDYESTWTKKGTTIAHHLGTMDYVIDVEYKEKVPDPSHFYQFSTSTSYDSNAILGLGFNQTTWFDKTENSITIETEGRYFSGGSFSEYKSNTKNAYYKVRLWKIN
ncbi:hypothetical protein SAMN06296036_105135 [Pseudobacteriovorax antillogorgiicola]|uniref:Uncharacterized protein n=2 Tax=Pseudobacteriovorax antillogorgiicola TaxID=1513793 RepID=A0A1Y6BMZ6_9BACT|nr:hypothetical protein EDD56_105189 [Pseudobacteriovorax antillogorgiicola]SMF12100.1 hypothetical protein SAMN06296036_105135 [Pseudobacteriovorax antillogorgiicola]